jgi:hypothetical protein
VDTLRLHAYPVSAVAISCADDGRTFVLESTGPDLGWIEHADAIPDRPGAWIVDHDGLVVTGRSVAEIHERLESAIARVESHTGVIPVETRVEIDSDRLRPAAEGVARALADLRAAHGSALERPEVVSFSTETIDTVCARWEESPFDLVVPTPVHAAAVGPQLCWAERESTPGNPYGLGVDILHAVTDYVERHETIPRIVIVESLGAVAVAPSSEEAERAREVLLDIVAIARLAALRSIRLTGFLA